MQVKMSHKTELPRARDGEMGHVTYPRCSEFHRNFPPEFVLPTRPMLHATSLGMTSI